MIVVTLDKQKDKLVKVGILTKNKVFKKIVDERKHFMHKEQGYGIQIEVMEQLAKLGCSKIFITVKPTNLKYSVDFNTWKNYNRIKDYGHGLQSFFPLNKMQVSIEEAVC